MRWMTGTSGPFHRKQGGLLGALDENPLQRLVLNLSRQASRSEVGRYGEDERGP